MILSILTCHRITLPCKRALELKIFFKYGIPIKIKKEENGGKIEFLAN